VECALGVCHFDYFLLTVNPSSDSLVAVESQQSEVVETSTQTTVKSHHDLTETVIIDRDDDVDVA
jgi:hypothetical protein